MSTLRPDPSRCITYPAECQRALSIAIRALAHLNNTKSPELRKPLITAFRVNSNFIARKTNKPVSKVRRQIKGLQKRHGFSLPLRSDVTVTYTKRRSILMEAAQ